ncbi:MAG: YggT family protein [Actinobacteria bacterium]|nr:YggT family protein [Actinomycetota bacterium]
MFMILIFARVILSWFPPTGGVIDQIQNLVITATEWIMGPLRRVIPPVRLGAAALDLSPLIVLLGITVLRSLLCP